MAYKYYIETECDRHYAFASEVAEYLYREAGIASPNQGAPVTLTRAMLAWLHTDDPKIFYNTKKGLRRVYPYGEKAAILLMQNCVVGGGTIEIDGKKYRYERKDNGSREKVR